MNKLFESFFCKLDSNDARCGENNGKLMLYIAGRTLCLEVIVESWRLQVEQMTQDRSMSACNWGRTQRELSFSTWTRNSRPKILESPSA